MQQTYWSNTYLQKAASIATALISASLLLLYILHSIQAADPSEEATLVRYVSEDGLCGGSNPCYSTIQQAIDVSAAGDSIKVSQGLYQGDGFRVISIEKPLTISGGYTNTNWTESFPQTQPTIIDAEKIVRRRAVHISITDETDVVLDGLTIQGGNVQGESGGGVYINNGNVTIRDCRITGNKTTELGGGIYLQSGILNVKKSSILNNQAMNNFPKGSGGGVFISDGSLILIESIVQDNVSTQYGGGLGTESGNLYVTNTSIFSNTSSYGGGIHINDSIAELNKNIIKYNEADSGAGVYTVSNTDSKLYENYIENNAASGSGGGLSLSGNTIMINNTIANNTAESNGGGILQNYYASISILQDNVIKQNTAGTYGGAIWVNQGHIQLSNSRIISNTAELYGGAIEVQGGSLELYNSLVAHNQAKHGGAIYLEVGSVSVLLQSNQLEQNTALANGGGIFVKNGDLEMKNNQIKNNAAGKLSGAIHIQGGDVIAENDIIAENTSDWEGVSISGGSLSAFHWTIADNGKYGISANGGSVVLTNTIVFSHSIAGLIGPSIQANNSLFSDNAAMCKGGAICNVNLTGNPSFVDAADGDYHITDDSDAIDQGVPTHVHTDIDFEPRIGSPDLGADEFWAEGSLRTIYLASIKSN